MSFLLIESTFYPSDDMVEMREGSQRGRGEGEEEEEEEEW